MIILRSALFNLFFFGSTFVLTLAGTVAGSSPRIACWPSPSPGRA